MLKLFYFFKHRQPHHDISDIKKYILWVLSTTVLIYSLVAPLAGVTLVLLLSALVIFLQTAEFFLPAFFTYVIAFVLVVFLRLSFADVQDYSDFIAGSALLVTLSRALKLKVYNDGQIVLSYLLFANGGILLLDTSLTLMFIVSVNIVFILGQVLRLQLNSFSFSRVASSMKGAMKVAIYSLPLMMLFVWIFNQSKNIRGMGLQKGSSSGVSSTMEASQIDRLALDHRVAFRVALDKPLPPMPVYWRVGSLDTSNGLDWSQRSSEKLLTAIPGAHCVYHQKIFKHDSFSADQNIALDVPVARFKTDERTYSAMSEICGSTLPVPLGAEDTKRYTMTTAKKTEKIKDLLDRMGAAGDPSAVVDRLSRFFRKSGFKYALEPKQQEKTSLENFLFENKEGYCVRYAAAAATLLRLKNIPARVVVGYAGGEYNPLGDYWLISYSDAHAWVEYWNGSQWQNYDPTGIVTAGRNGSQTFTESILHHPVVKWSWMAFDAVSFFIQKKSWNRGPLISFQDMTYDPWVAIGGLLLLLAALQVRERTRPVQKKVAVELAALFEALEKKGLTRAHSEGFDTFRQKVVADGRLSKAAGEIDSVLKRYIDFRYAAHNEDGDLLIRDLRKSRKKIG